MKSFLTIIRNVYLRGKKSVRETLEGYKGKVTTYLIKPHSEPT